MAFLEENLSNTVQGSHVMVVGTGGIGCELLKNLVLTGFQNISAVSTFATQLIAHRVHVYTHTRATKRPRKPNLKQIPIRG